MPSNDVRRLYFFIHLTGRDSGNTGIQRVVRSLGRVLAEDPAVELVPVRWSEPLSAIVHAEQPWRDVIGYHNGPIFAPSRDEGKPIHLDTFRDTAEDWLLIPEVPHLGSHSPEHPSVSLLPLLGYARTYRFRVGVIFHDLLPLTFPAPGKIDELEQLKFTVYGQALLQADVVLGVSRSVTETLWDWWGRTGVRPQALPTLQSVPLPEEMAFMPRRPPDAPLDSLPRGPIDFVTWGTISAHKNQIAMIEAFNRLCERRPGLNLRLHMVGHIEPRVERQLGEAKARSNGRVLTYGYLPDEKLTALVAGCRAVAFLSLAEGFGLPIVESLWAGKPCLCSNVGSMAEIAANGGCLAVSPTEIDAISAGFELFATDIGFYNTKLAEIRVRKFRTWRNYASDVLNSLQMGKTIDEKASETPELVKLPSLIESTRPEQTSPLELLRTKLLSWKAKNNREYVEVDVSLHRMRYHRKSAQLGAEQLFDGSALRYDKALHHELTDSDLFFGPYMPLPRGNHIVKLYGSVAGTLNVRLTRSPGIVIKRVKLKSLNTTIPFHLAEDAVDFEVVMSKSESLSKLEISRISIMTE